MNLFEKVVCGVDGTVASDAALEQVVRLSSPETQLILVHAFSITPVNEVELMLGEAWAHEEELARAMLDSARAWAIEAGGVDPGRVEIQFVPGPKAKGLLEVVGNADATLVCVGIHGRSRLVGAIRGSVASNALHSAPCSLLIARDSDATFPRSILCGVDGSTGSQRAVDVTRELGERLGCSVRYVSAEDGLDVSFEEAARQTPAQGDLEILPGRPIDVLIGQSASVDLLVLGTRGLGGTRAIGSVSERVAHDAECSVLVVR